MLLGFVINPIAGMGGSVGLKGTDGEAYELARGRGAAPVSYGRAMRALAKMEGGFELLTASGAMGEALLKELGIPCEVVHSPSDGSTGEDTKAACAEFVERGAGLIVFCGGDGTARDVMDVVGENVPVIGIPSGVKMHSAVFANTPEEAGEAVRGWIDGERETRLAEVMDVDEDAFRAGELKARLYGYVRVPKFGALQPPKGAVFASSDDEQKATIAEFVVEAMEPGVLYILGPGTTTRAVAERMGRPKTLLGVDVYRDGEVVLKDAAESDILDLLAGKRAVIVLTPIGRQGFIFGRGNQQISPKVVESVGARNVQIIATPEKLRETPLLHSDSGDRTLDVKLKGFHKVLVGYSQYRMVRLDG